MNKISRFWHELKRRNVVRRNTVYAGTAFVILELVSIVAEPLKLPEWTLTFMIVLLSVGFVISIILSWIYDVKPDGGLERTRPLLVELKEENDGEKEKSTHAPAWKIASYVSFAVIIGLVVLNLYPGSGRSTERMILDKSIAVLPFINDSDERENEYFINGTMEAILDNLSRIEDLRVISRTSVEKYRGADKSSVPDIAKELNVGYVLEGSGQKSGDQIRLFVQLLDGNSNKHLWSKDFIRDISDIFSLQSEIARLVASELQAIITPEEERLINKVLTTDQTAYDFFQKGLEELNKYWADNSRTDLLDKAEDLYRYALEYDSTFAAAYVELASIYEQKYFNTENRSEASQDSIGYLAEHALRFDPTNSNAHRFRGTYYQWKGMPGKALEEY